MSTDHCPHCDESCRVGPDPEYHAATSAVGYIWFAGEGCPVCRALEQLREMADEAESVAIKANVDFLGLIDSSDERDLMRREQLRGVAQQFTAMRWAYNKAADHIEAGR